MSINNKWFSCFTDNNSTVQFNPATNISNIYAYWKSDSGVVLTGSNQVYSWTDSVNGHVVSQSNSSFWPTFTGSYTNMNDKPVITTNGSNQRLISNEAASTWGFLNGPTGSTIAVVCYNNSIGAQGLVGTDVGGAGRSGRCLLFNHATVNKINARTSVSGAGLSAHQTTDIIANSGSVYAMHGISQGGSSVKASSTTYVSTSVAFTLSALTPESTLMIGHTNGHNYFNGSIAEVIIYSKKLSETEMAQLALYFTTKYGAQP